MSVTKTELLIMELLVSGSAYGLELVHRSEGKLKRGTVYVLLQRIEEKGFIKSQRQPRDGNSKSARRTYFLTGAGAQALSAYEELWKNLEGIKLT